MRFICTFVLASSLFTLPALAEEQTTCWQKGSEAGLFSGETSPSRTCRENGIENTSVASRLGMANDQDIPALQTTPWGNFSIHGKITFRITKRFQF